MDDAIDLSDLEEVEVKKGTILQNAGDFHIDAYVVKSGSLLSEPTNILDRELNLFHLYQ